MVWSESDSRCQKHPKNTQSPGVCSVCLRERLAQLSSSNSVLPAASSASSSLSSYSSAYESSSASPMADPSALGRSRSMVNTVQDRSDDAVMFVEKINKKKKRGFWSKLLRPIVLRRRDVSLHSKTVKEVAVN
ncbi:hypothetical protein ACLOJK_013468 [Asimina triloba]